MGEESFAEMSPTILQIQGWRLFFYSNEGDEPIHIHARNGEAECKYWLHPSRFDIDEARAYSMTPALRRNIRKIIFDHFELIVESWSEHFGSEFHERS